MCGYFGTKKKKKKSGSNRCNPLNSSIENIPILLAIFMQHLKENVKTVKP